MQLENDSLTLSECAFPIATGAVRLCILAVACFVAFSGVLCNSLLVRLFLGRKPIFEPNLALLAALDALLCLFYLTIFGGAEVFAHNLRIRFIYELVYAASVYGFMLSKVVQLAIPLILILTSLQRWCWINHKRTHLWSILQPHGRGVLGIVVVFLCFLSRLPVAFCLEVYTFVNCSEPFQTKEVWPADTCAEWYTQYDVALTCTQVFGPFVLLTFLNTAIVYKLRQQRQFRQESARMTMDKSRASWHRKGSKSAESHAKAIMHDVTKLIRQEHNAMHTTVVIVITYLICNSCHIVLTVIETWLTHWVYDQRGWTKQYIWASDSINILFMVSSAVRIFIYYGYQPPVRRKIIEYLSCKSTTTVLTYSYSTLFTKHKELFVKGENDDSKRHSL